jgi:hypothetical protein
MSQPLLGNIYWIYQINTKEMEEKDIGEWANVYVEIVKVQVVSLHLNKTANAVGVCDYDNDSYNKGKEFCVHFEKFFDSKEEAEKAAKIKLKETLAEIEKKITREHKIAECYRSCINSF